MLYHGGYNEVSFPQIIIGKYAKDFGYGFYCTEFREQAIRWAKRFDTPVLSTYNLIENKSLNVLQFDTMTEEWLDFIINCRSGMAHNYDIVSGPMANDQIYNYVSDYMNGILTKEQFWILAKFKHPTHQICFCTQEAIKCLHFLKSEKL